MAEQCLSSMLLSILTSNFGVIFAFWVLNGLFWASIFMLPLIMGRFCFGPQWATLGVELRLKSCSGVCSYRLAVFAS